MTSSEWPRLERALGGLDGFRGDAAAADGAITSYFKQKFSELLANEHRKRSGAAEDEATIALWARHVTERVALDAPALYRLFELQLKGELGEFWNKLDWERPDLSASRPKAAPAPPPDEDAQWNMKGGRRFHCSEGCEFVGDELYLAHRDRGHHPVPI